MFYHPTIKNNMNKLLKRPSLGYECMNLSILLFFLIFQYTSENLKFTLGSLNQRLPNKRANWTCYQKWRTKYGKSGRQRFVMFAMTLSLPLLFACPWSTSSAAENQPVQTLNTLRGSNYIIEGKHTCSQLMPHTPFPSVNIPCHCSFRRTTTTNLWHLLQNRESSSSSRKLW